MAALALGPLLSLATPLLMPLIGKLVTWVEGVFTTPKAGNTKMSTVQQAVTSVVESLVTSGKLPAQLDQASITALIQVVVDNLKQQNLLNGSDVQPAPNAGAPVPASTQPVTASSPLQGTILKVQIL